MLCTKIIRKISGSENKKIETIEIEWFERSKKILRKISSSGEEVGIRLEDNSVELDEGDVVFEDENKIVAIEIAPSDLIEVEVKTMVEMGRCCFELGNRHLPLAITENSVRCPFDEPTLDFMKHRGFEARKVRAKFTGYTECKAHEHHHGHHHHEHTD